MFFRKGKHKLVPVNGYEGLVECEICGAAEGQLLAFCPGFKLTVEAMEACYNGNVVDLEGWKRWQKYGNPALKKRRNGWR